MISKTSVRRCKWEFCSHCKSQCRTKRRFDVPSLRMEYRKQQCLFVSVLGQVSKRRSKFIEEKLSLRVDCIAKLMIIANTNNSHASQTDTLGAPRVKAIAKVY
eukprot:TRINITY_DN465_c0_g1_i2.p1 TRINITY_DN465_c0_g1~~TRINITY_DN465_c0_g1_i2.p1  ORF type:complete len:103 (-),score=8.11 TRINITY_DN465_c0_g1_i2:150-458(-)